MLPDLTYRIVEAQQREMPFEAPFVVGVSDHAFAEQLRNWLSFTRCVTPTLRNNLPATASDALASVLQRTGWSFRDVGRAIGVKHTEARRILHRERAPRDGVARRILDLETLTRHLDKTTNGNQQSMRLALETTPIGRSESAAAVIYREHDVARAMMHATEVLFPRTKMLQLDPASLYLEDAIAEINGA